jgi:hypothetical protein
VTGDLPSGAELRDRYGRPEQIPVAFALELLGRPDVGPGTLVAFRYQTEEAARAFAASNFRRHGHGSLGPVQTDQGWVGAVVLAFAEGGNNRPPDGV